MGDGRAVHLLMRRIELHPRSRQAVPIAFHVENHYSTNTSVR